MKSKLWVVEVESDKKSALWKVRIAAELKRTTSAPSTWIAQKLNMGAPQLFGSYVKQWGEDSQCSGGTVMASGHQCWFNGKAQRKFTGFLYGPI